VVTVTEVEACKELCVTAFIDEFGDEREWIPILDCDLVAELAVDLTRPGFRRCHSSSVKLRPNL
jgi:hypothetical protein